MSHEASITWAILSLVLPLDWLPGSFKIADATQESTAIFVLSAKLRSHACDWLGEVTCGWRHWPFSVREKLKTSVFRVVSCRHAGRAPIPFLHTVPKCPTFHPIPSRFGPFSAHIAANRIACLRDRKRARSGASRAFRPIRGRDPRGNWVWAPIRVKCPCHCLQPGTGAERDGGGFLVLVLVHRAGGFLLLQRAGVQRAGETRDTRGVPVVTQGGESRDPTAGRTHADGRTDVPAGRQSFFSLASSTR